MGTRSTYRIIEKYNEEENQLALVYVQYDGYPEGHPADIAKWLSEGTVVNGFNPSTPTLAFNGAGCLAARMIGHLKQDRIGNVYLHAFKDRGNADEDYMYDIIVDQVNTSIKMIAYDSDNTIIFEGSVQEFANKYHKQTV